MPRDSSDEEEDEYSYDSEFESLESLSENSVKSTVEEETKAQEEETIEYDESFISFDTECEKDAEETKACGSSHEENVTSPMKRLSVIDGSERKSSTLPLHEICNNVEDKGIANRSTKEDKKLCKPIESKEQIQLVSHSRKPNLESSLESNEPVSNESKDCNSAVQNQPLASTRKSFLSSRPSLGPRLVSTMACLSKVKSILLSSPHHSNPVKGKESEYRRIYLLTSASRNSAFFSRQS